MKNIIKGKTGWSASGELGTPIPATSSPAPDKAVRLQVDFGEQRAEYYTLQFSLIPPPNVDAGILLRGKAVITWAVEGNFVTREVQVLNGTAVSGVGQGVTIKIIDDSVENSFAGNGATYVASVQVAKGVRPNIQHPPLYQPELFQTIAPAANDTFTIPENSGITSVFIMGRVLTGPVVDEDDIYFTFRANGTQLAFNNWSMRNTWVPLPPGTTDIECTNGHSTDIFVAAIFGVEG